MINTNWKERALAAEAKVDELTRKLEKARDRVGELCDELDAYKMSEPRPEWDHSTWLEWKPSK